jgi:lysyl-tRNA synthetase class 1
MSDFPSDGDHEGGSEDSISRSDDEMEKRDEVIIGRGTWLDQVANEVIDRERKLGRDISKIRVESGLGASGIPHVGSLGDAARAFGVKMALEEVGYASELVAFSDDMDALRKVPAGLPASLEDEIGKPVSEIKDPFGCHRSYGAHMSSLLIDGLERLGLSYVFESGYKAYKSGKLVNQIDAILRNAEVIGKKIGELTGQTKFQETLPYFPQCENCKRLNVARADTYDTATKRVHYRCIGDEIGRKRVEGCGHEGWADITKGEGKLSWKVEFAARWAALDIRYEAHGKELRDSVRINDWVCENILHFPAPYHRVYELFQDKSGRKMSKSTGNLVTPQRWLEFASPETLLLFYFKRIIGARNISEEDVPAYMDEYDSLEDLYFGKIRENNKMKEARQKGIYYYVNLRNPPTQPAQHVPYSLLVELATVAPAEDMENYIAKRLIDYRVVKQIDDGVRSRIRYAINWSKEFALHTAPIELSEKERAVLRMISDKLTKLGSTAKPEDIQALIFESARTSGIPDKELFPIVYKILLGQERGPRLGNYISDIGIQNVVQKFEKALDGNMPAEHTEPAA